jgi:hypothetical protein
MGLDVSRLMEGALRPAAFRRKLKNSNCWPVANKSHQASDEINCRFCCHKFTCGSSSVNTLALNSE